MKQFDVQQALEDEIKKYKEAAAKRDRLLAENVALELLLQPISATRH